jgi:16S rRNA (cytosine967-C5)-methyltransferase
LRLRSEAVVTPREVARRVLERVEKDAAWATPALDGELDRANLPPRDAALATELVYGVLRHRLRIDRALSAHADLNKTPPRVRLAMRVAAYQILFLRIPGYAAVDDAVDAAHAAAGPRVAGFANAVLRKLAAQGEPPLPAGRARIEIEHSMPKWILDELAATAPLELADAAAGLARPARLAGRANRRRGTRDRVIAELANEGVTAEPVGALLGAPDAFWTDDAGVPSRTGAFRAGLWTVQDVAAQRVVAQLVMPRDGMRILDACAGVGGKATYMAEIADATIHAADLSKTKLGLLAEHTHRLKVGGIEAIQCDLRDPRAALEPAYDVVMLDAPCTGLGVLRRHPDAKWRLQPADVDRMATLQRELLDAVAPRVIPGGALVYAVCTITRREGEEQIDRFLATHRDFTVDNAFRTWPHQGGADGFFAARLARIP